MNLKRVVPFNDDSFVIHTCGVITITKESYNKDKEYVNKLFDNYFNNMKECNLIEHYYFIYHNDDENNLHIHFILDCYKQIRITTLCNKISQFCNVNTSIISIDKLVNINMMLLYFLHKDKDSILENKHQYESLDIISDITSEEIDLLLNADIGLDVDYLLSVCACSNSLIDVMRKLGLKTYHKYRYEIKDLYEYTKWHADKYISNEETPF